ncbi:MAG: hypothetical protein IJV11_05075, partial [Muribaculaceae bacterium]|nr:hypothetical protein [Muribaculaceae bacterium]
MKSDTKVLHEIMSLGDRDFMYVADRYKKAGTILDLMMEKLPTNVSPFTVQMGEQVANTYYNLAS